MSKKLYYLNWWNLFLKCCESTRRSRLEPAIVLCFQNHCSINKFVINNYVGLIFLTLCWSLKRVEIIWFLENEKKSNPPPSPHLNYRAHSFYTSMGEYTNHILMLSLFLYGPPKISKNNVFLVGVPRNKKKIFIHFVIF